MKSAKVQQHGLRDTDGGRTETHLLMIMIVCQTYPRLSRASNFCLQIVMLHLDLFGSECVFLCARYTKEREGGTQKGCLVP